MWWRFFRWDTEFDKRLGTGWLVMNGLSMCAVASSPFGADVSDSHAGAVVPGVLGGISVAFGVLVSHGVSLRGVTFNQPRLWLKWVLIWGISFGLFLGLVWLISGAVAASMRDDLTMWHVGLTLAVLWGFGVGFPSLAMIISLFTPRWGILLVFLGLFGVGAMTEFLTAGHLALASMALCTLIVPAWVLVQWRWPIRRTA